MKFKDSASFLKFYLKNPEKIISAAAIAGFVVVGSQKISAQSLQFIRPTELNPAIYRDGHVFSSRTYAFEADSSSKKFLEQSFEYRFGKKFKKESQYNFALEVGRNNMYINGKLVPDLTFARIHSTIQLSKFLDTPLDIKLGYSKEVGNFSIKDIKILDKTSLSSSVESKNMGYGASIFIDKGKVIGYDGLVDVKFDQKRRSAGLRLVNNLGSSKFLSIQGHAQMSDGKVVFMPMGQLGVEITKDGKRIPFVNYALYYVPNKKVEVFVHRNISNNNKGGLYLELNYILGNNKKKKTLNLRELEIKEKRATLKDTLDRKENEKNQERLKSRKKKSSFKNFFKELLRKKPNINTLKRREGYPMIRGAKPLTPKRPKRPI